jgi:hypothetical protein
MPKEFHQGSLSLRYPDNWSMEREESENGWTLSLFSPRPATAFLTLTLDTNFPESDQMADTVLDAMKAEYPQLEADESTEQLAGQWTVGHDITFISLDLTSTCWTRSFDTPDGTVLLLCQSADVDMPQQEPILRAICASLHITRED